MASLVPSSHLLPPGDCNWERMPGRGAGESLPQEAGLDPDPGVQLCPTPTPTRGTLVCLSFPCLYNEELNSNRVTEWLCPTASFHTKGGGWKLTFDPPALYDNGFATAVTKVRPWVCLGLTCFHFQLKN